jgi:hypothetical protein
MANPTTIGQNVPIFAGGLSSYSFNTTRLINAGEKVWVFVSWFNASTTLSSVIASGLAFTIDSQQANGGDKIALAWADANSNISSGTTITANLSAAGDSADICGFAAPGWAVGAALSRNSGTSGQTWTSGTIAVATGDILVGGCYGDGAGSLPPYNTPSGGNTEVHDFGVGAASDSGTATEYQIGSGTSIAAQGTIIAAGPTVITALAASFLIESSPSLRLVSNPFPKPVPY